jgi:ankyrin repeat protein
MAIDPQLVADQFLRAFNVMAQNGHHRLARSLSGVARVTRVDDNLWDAICYNGARDKRTPFMYACQKGDVERVRFLLPHCGAEELYHEYSDRDGPLFIAARYGHPAVVAELCKYITGHKIDGALDFCSATNGWTPLMVAVGCRGCRSGTAAAKARYREVATCLFQYGCDLNAADKFGSTVLMQAINSQDTELASWLCELGVDVNFIIAGRSPLQEAILWNNLEIATVFCDHGADIGLSVIEYAKTLNRGRLGVGRWEPMVALLESRIA